MGSGDDKGVVKKNREVAAARLSVLEPHLVTVYQVHSPEVVTVTEPFDIASRPKADGMVTNVPGLAIGVLTADCGPILFADAQRGVIGAAHAGWKGALGGVTSSTLDAMEKLGAKRCDIVAVVGPMIQARSYEVGPEFPQGFIAEYDDNKRLFAPSERPRHSMLDL